MLLHLAETSQDIQASLKTAGLLSCFADEEWMRARSTPSEWEEYERIRRAYAEEIVFSKSWSGILLSNPGEYPWRTALIEAKVRERFEQHGDVHRLFMDPRRRHLTELAAPQRELMRVIGAGPSAALNARNAIYDELRAEELRTSKGPIAASRAELSAARLNESTLLQLFIRELCARALGRDDPADVTIRTEDGPELQLRSAGFTLGIRPGADVAGTGAAVHGAFYAQVFVRSGAQGEPSIPFSGAEMIQYGRALRGHFAVYSRFGNRAELAICFAAWIEAMLMTIRRLNERGCGLRITPADAIGSG